MLSILGKRAGRFCDGLNRRDFLKLGGLAMGGLALPDLLRAEAAAGTKGSHKAVIMVFLAGGPPHQDMFDLKPEAPAGIRGDFKPIATNVPGLDICEHMPRLAKMMDRFVVIRTLVGAGGEHSAGQCQSGFRDLISRTQGGRPSLGSIVAELQGPVHGDIPPFVGLSLRTSHAPWGDPGDPGYLGLSRAPFTPFRAEGGPGGKPDPMRSGSAGQGIDDATITPDRLSGRHTLLNQLDDVRRALDHSEAIRGMDSFTQSAFEVLASRKVFNALDLSREDPRLRARYGMGDLNAEYDGPPCCMDHFLMARRLVEAGVRVVTLSFGRWDTHSDNFGSNAIRIPKLDMGLSALMDDLAARGMDKDVSVVVWGEFGRTPKINKDAGRDHWPPVNFALLAGGGMRTGQVIGSTDKIAAYPKDHPVTFQQVFSTLYHNLGIDPATQVYDRAGRPMTLLEETEPLTEVI